MATVPPNADVVFFPWVRQGAAAAIGTVETLGPLRSAVDLTASLTVNTAQPVSVTVRLRGPADAIGIDANEIVRMDPRPGTTDFEPNYFPAIEFDRPDFPWLFTPAKADGTARLRPWLCLVVVRDQVGVTLRSSGDTPLPALEIAPPAKPADELPNLAESHLWAHAQAASRSSANANELRSTLAGDPERSLSRLVCPRLLVPNTDYIACVVPAFDLGRKAGLGQEITEAELINATGLKPAWSITATTTLITLPFYHHWRFRTGEGGDFESLVSLLRPRPVPSGLGKRAIDISKPGFDLHSQVPAGTTLALEGALQPINGGPTPWPDGVAQPFQTELAKIVNAPGIAEAIDPKADPLLAPPLYGRWHVARATVTPGSTPWFDEVNLDPRHRSVAAFGTRIIQEHQEALMASAWEQAADLQRANQRVRQLQLSLVVNTSLHTRHFNALEDDAALRVGSPAFGRVAAGVNDSTAKTLAGRLANSPLPLRATSAAMRRIGRDRGPLTRRIATQGVARSATPTWVAMLNTASAAFVAQPWYDIASVNVVRDRIAAPTSVRMFMAVTEADVANMRGRPTYQIAAEGQAVVVPAIQALPPTADNLTARNFRAAARTHLARIDPARSNIAFAPPPPLTMRAVRDSMLAEIEPARTLVALARAVVSTAGTATPPTNTAPTAAVPIDTIMAAPKFSQAMYEPLRDLSQELLLPGLETVDPNTVLGLQTNRRFIEAYMVGLNFEMARELLWRGFPTDQRGTYFDRFWDTRGSGAAQADVKPLHEWDAGLLGTLGLPQAPDQFVMLMRSDLLRRYPTAVIYATKAVMSNGVRTPSTDPADEVYPSFRGSLPPDVFFFGFDLSVHVVVGDKPAGAGGRRAFNPGYFIVIQEQPSEPRFGLDVGTPVGNSAHLRVSDGAPAGMELNGLTWGHNAAHMAGITRQQPVRVLMHASQFVSKP